MSPPVDRGTSYPYPWWALKPWHGMQAGTWARALVDHRFRINSRRAPMSVPIITFATLLNSMAAREQRRRHGRAIAATKVPPPIFVLGHWRSGTTLLQELLSLDDRFAYPTTRHTFGPADSIVLRPLIDRLGLFVPKHRPMDDMPMSMDSPQEDEWALCNLGVPSPYLTMLFPNDPPAAPEYLDLERLPADARHRWQQALYAFMQTVTYRDGRPLILKSPPHTARVRTLHELFPAARYVHIVRDPRAVFPSTIRLWKSLYSLLALQQPTFEGLDESVHSTFERMYAAFDRQRSVLPPDRIVEVRFEDLVADPIGNMRRIYEVLALGPFDEARDRIQDYLGERREYRAATYQTDPELEATLERRWGPYLERFGYFPASADTSGA